jgi:hypothetical protein
MPCHTMKLATDRAPARTIRGADPTTARGRGPDQPTRWLFRTAALDLSEPASRPRQGWARTVGGGPVRTCQNLPEARPTGRRDAAPVLSGRAASRRARTMDGPGPVRTCHNLSDDRAAGRRDAAPTVAGGRRWGRHLAARARIPATHPDPGTRPPDRTGGGTPPPVLSGRAVSRRARTMVGPEPVRSCQNLPAGGEPRSAVGNSGSDDRWGWAQGPRPGRRGRPWTGSERPGANPRSGPPASNSQPPSVLLLLSKIERRTFPHVPERV